MKATFAKNIKRISVFIAALTLFFLCACAAENSASEPANSTAAWSPTLPDTAPPMTGGGTGYDTQDIPMQMAPAADADDALPSPENIAPETEQAPSTGNDVTITQPQDSRKIIMYAQLHIESTDYDATLSELQQAVLQAQGHFSHTSITGESGSRLRSAVFSIRIPAQNYSSFLSAASVAGNLLSQQENSEDVTTQYTDIEARLSSLKTQETRLLELMEQAETLEDLLTVQSYLTDVQYEIDYYTSLQNTYDDLITYSTIQIYVDEVVAVTPSENFGSRFASAFSQSWREAGKFFQNLSILLISNLPGFLFILVLLLPVILLIMRARRRKKRLAPAQGTPVYAKPSAAPVQAPSTLNDEAKPVAVLDEKNSNTDAKN